MKRKPKRSWFSTLVLFSFIMPALAGAADVQSTADAETQEAQNAVLTKPNLGFFLGAYFLEPRELSNSLASAPVFVAQPLAKFWVQAPVRFFQRTFLILPDLGVLLPESTREQQTRWSGLIGLNLGLGFSQRWIAKTGIGVHWNWLQSNGRNAEIGGSFVTPSGSALSWFFTLNLGLSYLIDSKFRVEFDTGLARPLDSVARKLRWVLGMAYAFN
ncbi:MAG: hypothetical protein AB1540_04920 [Bdellovibrionota bacterium]